MIKRIQKKYRSLKKENSFSGIADDPEAKMEPTPTNEEFYCNICNRYFHQKTKSLNKHIKIEVHFIIINFLLS